MPLAEDIEFEPIERSWSWEKDDRDAKELKALLHKW